MTRTLAEFGVADHLAHAPANILRELIQISMTATDLVSLAGGLPADELFDSDGIRDATEQVLLQNSRSYLQYGSTDGMPALRGYLAELTRLRGVQLDTSDLIVTSGAQQANDLVARCLLQPGDAVIVERPTFITALQTFRAARAEVIDVDNDVDGPSLEALEAAIHAASARGVRVKLIYLVPNFTNPAGRVIGARRRGELLDAAVRHGITILEDDPYGELWFDHAPPPPLAAMANAETSRHVVYVSSLSKTVSPGLRIGWLCAPPELAQVMRLIKSTADIHSSVFAQSVAAAYLASGRLPQRVAMLRACYKAKGQALAGALAAELGDGFRFEEPAGGMFLWGRLAGIDDTPGFARSSVTEHGVAIVPGEPFFGGAPEAGWLRLSFSQGSTSDLQEGAARLARAWRLRSA
jgi:DNA-binding transcriptional MocR family regulator